MASALHFFLLVSVGLLAASVEADNDCPRLWTPFGERCFRFYKTPANWITAEKNCIAAGGNLASIRNDLEFAFVKSMMLKVALNKLTWIGGHDAVQENAWQWSDGSSFTLKKWAVNQPDNFKKSEHCMDVSFGATEFVNDSPCAATRPYLCSRDE